MSTPTKPSKPQKPRRGRTPLPEAERKDRLVQARVDEDLDAALRLAARKKRTTVSNLIRNVLEDTFNLVDDIVAETANLTETVKRDAKRIAASAKGRARGGSSSSGHGAPSSSAVSGSPLGGVYAWQEVVLNRGASCASCGRELPRGAHGLFGLQDDPNAPKLWLCPDCGEHR
jgi:hypothetical protein